MVSINRETIIEYIEYLVSYSRLIPDSLVEYAKHMDDEKLEKLFLIIFDAIKQESKLNEEDISTIKILQSTFVKDAQITYQQLYINMIKKVEDKEKLEHEIMDKVLFDI